MSIFQTLPIEIHQQLARTCAELSRHALTNFALISRSHYQIALPLLHHSLDLTQLPYAPGALSQCSYHLVPHHRIEIKSLSICFRESRSCSPDEDLDECLSRIISLLGMLSELKICLEEPSSESSYQLTISALQRLKHLTSLTIQGRLSTQAPPPTLQLILVGLPMLVNLRTFKLRGVSIEIPGWEEASSRVTKLDMLDCQVSDLKFNLGTFINLFGPQLNSLRLRSMPDIQRVDAFQAPQLHRLWLGVTKTSSGSGDSVGLKSQPLGMSCLKTFGAAGPIKELVLENLDLFRMATPSNLQKSGFLHLEQVSRPPSMSF